jgi:hypothetical protein
LFVEMFETLLRQGGDQRVPIREMPIGRGAGDAHPLGRFGQGETGCTPFGHQGAGRGKQGLTQPPVMIAPPFCVWPASVRFGAHPHPVRQRRLRVKIRTLLRSRRIARQGQNGRASLSAIAYFPAGRNLSTPDGMGAASGRAAKRGLLRQAGYFLG